MKLYIYVKDDVFKFEVDSIRDNPQTGCASIILTGKSKVKTLAPVDVEKVKSVGEFVEKTVTENRLKQGLEKMVELGHPLDAKSTGEYIKWVMGDVFKEELDTLAESGLTTKDVSGQMATKIRKFYLENI